MKNKLNLDSDIFVGLRNGLVYYLIGGVIVILVHYLVGWEYIHAPPASFFVFLLILFGGIIRAGWNLLNIKNQMRVKSNKYELIIHILPALIGLFLIAMILFVD